MQADPSRTTFEIQRSFQTVLRRAECPSPQQIGEYELDLVWPEQRQQVAAHIVDCPRCAEELASTRAFLADAGALEPRPSRSPLVLIAELIAPKFQPAVAGLRGSGAQDEQTYRAGAVTITIGPVLGSRPGRWSIVGLVLADSGTTDATAGWEIQLGDADSTIGTVSVDDLGNFVFDDVRAGHYRLRLLLADKTIVVEDVRLGMKE